MEMDGEWVSDCFLRFHSGLEVEVKTARYLLTETGAGI